MKVSVGSVVVLVIGVMFVHSSQGSPSSFSLFQGSPYSSSGSRQRNKNWCAFVVQKNVTCAVLALAGEDLDPCPPHRPDCSHRLMHHAQTRPMYKIGYKQVTELEWRCCPGYQGHDCKELKDSLQKPNVIDEPLPDAPPTIHQQQSILGPEKISETHPWSQPGKKGPHQQESQRVQVLEEEVERLSQTVLDLQAMMATNANLRLDLQEDVTKIILSTLGNLQQPQDVKTAGIEAIVLPSGTDELQNQISQLSSTIGSNANSIQDLQVRLQNIDGQMHRLTEASNAGLLQPSSTPGTNECPCQAYIDEKLSALREELLQGMDIKIADMKNACDYKVMSLQEQCEERETSYLSLAELLDSKEAELRKEIQELRAQLPTGNALELDNHEVQKLKDTQDMLKESIRRQNATLARLDLLEARVSLTQKNKSENSEPALLRRVESLDLDFRQSQDQVKAMNVLLDGLDGRVANIEGVCGRFEPMADSLKRIKDGLNKHVNGLWTCVRHLNSTVLAHTRDITRFKSNSRLPKDRQDGLLNPPTGAEGPATVKVSIEGAQPLGRVNGSSTSITGYAGAPGYPSFPAANLSPDSVSAQIPLRTLHMATGEGRATMYVTFSAGLTLVPFPGEIGIIRFNNVLLNDGGHYDPRTGVFTVPMDGRYLLSAVLTAQAGDRVQALLSVANRNVQKLWSSGSDDCVCGGSASLSLALHLKRGQRVALLLTSGTLAISASSEVLSSFSGVLLYPTVAKR